MALNKIVIMGRLIKDPEMRRFQSGSACTSVTLAVQRDYKNKETGKYDSDFFNCTSFGKHGEFVSQYFKKGDLVVVCGRLQTRNYTDSDGLKHYFTEIVTDNFYHAESKRSKKDDEETTGQRWDELEEEVDSGTLPF